MAAGWLRAARVAVALAGLTGVAHAEQPLACGSAPVETGAVATPNAAALTIAIDDDDVARVTLAGGDDNTRDDTVLVRVVSGLPAPTAIAMYPGTRSCALRIPGLVAHAQLEVEVEAIGPGGGTSAAVTRELEVGGPRHRSSCGLGSTMMMLIVLAAAMLGVLIVGAIVISWLVRRPRASAPMVFAPEPLSLLAVERVARAVRRRAGLFGAFAIAGVVACLRAEPYALLATAPAAVGMIGGRGYLAACAILRALDRGTVELAEATATLLVVRTRDGSHQLEVSSRLLAAARGEAVPRSTRVR